MTSQFRFSGFRFCVALVACIAAPAQVFTQQGGKLVGSGFTGTPQQGNSVALSADGDTAVVGGPFDGNFDGGVWVYTRGTRGTWSQQGNKLVGSGATGLLTGGGASQGWSVSLSADGNTLLESGVNDNQGAGAVWIFTREGNGAWRQEGKKLVGTGATGTASQGYSVALSADGNTALVGGYADNNLTGAVWVFTRSHRGIWTQQGSKLVGTGAIGNIVLQGSSVALSADGNTAIEGGNGDNGTGAVWVFTRDSHGKWTQQGNKLVGRGAVGQAGQGISVALSANGDTALVGGDGDNGGVGAAWAFTRNSRKEWSQQGSKLVGTGTVGDAVQGRSVALSSDGNTALVGGFGDNTDVGAAWVFQRNSSGKWAQQESKLVGNHPSGMSSQGSSVALSADGDTAMLGGPFDNASVGAAWVFERPSRCATDISSRVTVTRGWLGYDHATKLFVQTVTVTNRGASFPNESLVLDGLSSNAKLTNEDGTTECTVPLGSPWIAIPGTSGTDQSASVTLTFSDPTMTRIQYSTRVLAGGGQQ